ncbi:hypothetical protein Tco_0578932, partial [Tanacetum coccineum]
IIVLTSNSSDDNKGVYSEGPSITIAKKLIPEVIFKSPIPIKGCVLGLANVETWDNIVKKFRMRTPERCADKSKGKRKNRLVEIQADDHDLLVNSDNENDDMLGYESEKYSDDEHADGTNHAEDTNGTNHSDLKLVKRGITRLYKFRMEYGKLGGIKIKVTPMGAYEVDETQSSVVVRDKDARIQKKSNGLVTLEKVFQSCSQETPGDLTIGYRLSPKVKVFLIPVIVLLEAVTAARVNGLFSSAKGFFMVLALASKGITHVGICWSLRSNRLMSFMVKDKEEDDLETPGDLTTEDRLSPKVKVFLIPVIGHEYAVSSCWIWGVEVAKARKILIASSFTTGAKVLS